jgi:RNA polymerase sigma-70 factor (ECF subfamily)
MTFHDDFVARFHARFDRLYRYLQRLSGDPDLASDLAQETLVKLYQRGSMPDAPEGWMIAVATNLFRNVESNRVRRARLLTVARGAELAADPPPSPAEALEAEESGRRMRNVIDKLPLRERQLLLLRAEGYSYREIAVALDLNEASVGTLLARAKGAFRGLYEGSVDAPG